MAQVTLEQFVEAAYEQDLMVIRNGISQHIDFDSSSKVQIPVTGRSNCMRTKLYRSILDTREVHL